VAFFPSHPICPIFKVLPLFTLLLLLFVTAIRPAYADWTSIGPDGGSAHVLALDPQNARHLIAGSRGLLLYRSQNAGESWTLLPSFDQPNYLYQTALNALAIDPGDSRTYYAGISATNARSTFENGAGLYKSKDAGQSWLRIRSLAGTSVYCLAIWEKDAHVVVAGTNRGIWRSRDSGETWTRISPESNYELSGIMSIAVDPKNADVIYAGTPHLPWKTSDGGKTWHNIHAGMIDDSDVFSIRIDQRSSERVYASACSGIYGSTTAGASWVKFQGIPSDNRRTHVITQDPKHPSTLYAATTLGLWKSSSGGAWRKTSTDSINAMVIDPDGTMYLAVDQRGLLKSEDGGETFREINHRYVNRTVTTIQSASGDVHPYLYASTVYDGRHGGLFRREDGTDQWELLANEEILRGRNIISFAALGGSGQLVAASYDGFLRSRDQGRTWTDMASGKAPEPPAKSTASKSKAKTRTKAPARSLPRSAHFLPPSKPGDPPAFPSPKIHIYSLKAATGKKPFLIAATSAGLYVSTDSDTWQPMKIVPKVSLPVTAIFVSPGDSGGLAAVTPAGFFLSHDRGATWLSTALPYKPDVIYEVAFDYQDPNLVIAATSDGIYQSVDGGKTWVFRYGGMPKGEVTSVIFNPSRHAEAFALYAGWIYRSADGGAHWAVFDRAGLGSVTFRTISFSLSDSGPQLYALAPQRGVFAYHTTSVDTLKTVTPSPQSAPN
jgi:photosystem II stability/assembly factor-like uncharacterized protein